MIYDGILERCPHVLLDGVGRDEWLEKRRGSIGGSDAGALMGMNDFASPLTVYMEKKGLAPKKEENSAMRRGNLLEPIIREETRRDFPGLEIAEVPAILYDPDRRHMSANLDGAILAKAPVEIRGETIEGLGGHEIKTSKAGHGWGEDEIPDAHYCQVQHYMSVAGLPWFLVSVYVLEDDSLRHYAIRRNDEFIARLAAIEKDFWENNILKDSMPAAVGIESEEEMITGIFEGADAPAIMTEEEIALCREYRDASDRIKELETLKSAAGTNLKAALCARTSGGKEKKLSASGGGYSVSWTTFAKRSADLDALKKDGLYERYSKTDECSRMTVSEKKGAA
ncbi:MAG: YqaJ viral recombinase family protein [Treponema sp.]|nr:YqaJ viral recombinase family protein [Treponema sp.]